MSVNGDIPSLVNETYPMLNIPVPVLYHYLLTQCIVFRGSWLRRLDLLSRHLIIRTSVIIRSSNTLYIVLGFSITWKTTYYVISSCWSFSDFKKVNYSSFNLSGTELRVPIKKSGRSWVVFPPFLWNIFFLRE